MLIIRFVIYTFTQRVLKLFNIYLSKNNLFNVPSEHSFQSINKTYKINKTTRIKVLKIFITQRNVYRNKTYFKINTSLRIVHGKIKTIRKYSKQIKTII